MKNFQNNVTLKAKNVYLDKKKKEKKSNLRKTFGKNIFVAIAYNTLTAQKYERSI